jgi:hypothetical protein
VILASPRIIWGECVGIEPPNMLKLMPTAFGGRLVERTEVGGDGYALMFDTTRTWKGSVQRRQVVYQLRSIDMSVVEIGREYIVFARQIAPGEAARLGVAPRRSTLVTSDCNGVQEMVSGDRSFRGLGLGRLVR